MKTFILVIWFSYGHAAPLTINEFDSMGKCEAVRLAMMSEPILRDYWEEPKVTAQNSACREIKY